jgi:PAS domain S-box-containing protein
MSFPLLRWRTRSWVGAIAVALGSTVAATAVRASIGLVAPTAIPFAPYILAILVTTFISGYAAGLIALGVGLITAWYFFMEPAFSFDLPSSNEVASILLFALVCGVEIFVAEALRRGFDRETARERRLARAQQSGAVGDWEWNLLTGEITWSENLYALMGRTPASFQPTPGNFAAFVHPDDIDRVAATLQTTIATGGRFDTEMRGIWPDGTVRNFVSRGNIVKDHADKPVRLSAVKIDITERRKADDALAASEERYRLLFSGMSEAYVVHDIVYDDAGDAVDFRAIEANPAFEVHTGLSRDIVVGRLASEFAPGGDPEWLRFFAEVVRTGRPNHIERYSPRPQRWIDLRAFPLGGPRLGIIFNDVTARKRVEAERNAAEARLVAAMQVAEVGYFDYNPIAGVVVPSGNYNAILGLSETAKARPLADFLAHIDPNDVAHVEEVVARALRERTTYRLEYRIQTGDGRVRWVASRGAAIADAAGDLRLVGAIFDITDRKQAELEGAAARERTEILFREMNHRTKNNLTIVASMLQLQASAAKQNIDLRNHLDAARERISTIAELHTSLYQGTTLGEIDFADYIRNLCNHIEISLFSAEKGITFAVDTDEVSLSADIAVPLGLVVNELATNAVKHAFGDEASDPRIDVSARQHGGNLVVCVRDNGRGLPTNGSSPKPGLGSRLIEAFVQQVGGRFTVSRTGGTGFEIVVPMQAPGADTGVALMPAAPLQVGA